MKILQETKILLPNKEIPLESYSVIACDQFTSQQEYWNQVSKLTDGKISTYHLVLPEVYLKQDYTSKVQQINQTMKDYLQNQVFTTYENSYIYVRRTLLDGSIRQGLIAMIDLEAYDYQPGSTSLIRASEKTVIERIPPRKKVRENAPIELPHVLLLCDDQEDLIFKTINALLPKLPLLYHFDLMMEGGYIEGYLIQKENVEIVNQAIDQYEQKTYQKYESMNHPVIYAVGDGNHSLATAKACYEEKKQLGSATNNSRFAMVELGNIHEDSLKFEPIHRVVMNCEADRLLQAIKEKITAPTGFPVIVYTKDTQEVIYLDTTQGEIDVAILQAFLDEYVKDHPCEVDYIHDDESLITLARKENAIGFILQPMGKDQFFKGIVADGVLPRKTFSMGHAREKRYYLEAREI